MRLGPTISFAGIATAAMVTAGWAVETTTPGAEATYGWKDGVTLAIAVVGAVLGILNYWNTISTKRVRIHVKPTFAYSFPALQAPKVGIEVINLSTFAVTVVEVGFTLVGTTSRAGTSNPSVIDGKPWPRRLEAREAVSTYLRPPTGQDITVKAVYATLASGERITRRGPFIANLRKAMAQGEV